jgi:hypothetical protein
MESLRVERMGLSLTLPSGSARAQAGKEREPNRPANLDRASPPGDETTLRISYDKAIGRIVVQFVDDESAVRVRQLPSEEVVAFLRRFREVVPLLINVTV